MSVANNPNIVTNGIAMYLDSANSNSFSPNTFSKPTDIYGWVNTPTGNNCNLSVDPTVTSPFGSTPLKMAVTGADPHTPTYNTAAWNVSTVANSQTWTISVWAKASVATTGAIFIFGANSSGVGFVDGAWIGIAATGFNITTEWQRFSSSITFNNVAVAFIQTRLDGPDASGTGQNIWWDGLQVELASTPSTFNPITNTNRATWTDISRNSNSGTLVNYPASNTSNNRSLVFNGTNNSVTIGSTASLQFLNRAAYSFETWVYPIADASASYPGFVDRESNPGSGRDGYNLYYTKLGQSAGSNYVATERWCTGTSTNVGAIYTDAVFFNNWQCYCATYDGTTLSFYRNGALVNSAASSGNITNATKNVTIGVRGGVYSNSRIATTRFYNISLTADQVVQNFNALRGRYGI
jgi:Concanavalin A-like lectin/glucanases superfamily